MLLCAICLTALLLLAAEAVAGEPIRLHPGNPHYFLFRGRPTILITSAEHYGAVLNLDFDYAKYVDTLRRDGMNHTRLFVGAYCEPQGAFNIARNTLAPAAGRFICPWARSDQPGYANGGNKFDLSRWDEAYFARLGDFLTRASEAGVVVEVNLFCPFYGDEQWGLSPMNARNNVNGIGQVPREQAYLLDRASGLLDVQERLVRKMVEELQGFDNIFYEVMNEPYITGVPMDWQRRIADLVVEAESSLPRKHLVSQNVANGKALVADPHPAISIFNFHYAFPPETVTLNYGLDRVIGDNETGFSGNSDARYRMEGWAFILAGGGLYNNLDYSFTVGHEDGTFAYPPTQPGGGGVSLRRQLGILRDFVHSFEFVRMKPMPEVIDGLPEGVSGWLLGEEGRQYAGYLCRPGGQGVGTPAGLRMTLPQGSYRAEWVGTLTGDLEDAQAFEHPGGVKTLLPPAFADDVALRVTAG